MSEQAGVNGEIWEQLRVASELMAPYGGSLETTAACQALFDVCCEQQHLIDALERRLAAPARERRTA